MDIKNTLNDYKYKTELHAHTSPVSPCGDFEAEHVIKLYSEIGCDSVVITNHLCPWARETEIDEFTKHYLSDYYRAVEAGQKLGVNVILGFELRFTENHNDYLIYGVCPEDVRMAYEYLDAGIERFYKDCKNDKNVIIQAHPFRKSCVLAPIGSTDGIESFNMHPGHNSAVSLAAQYARQHDLLATGGTDFHHANHQGLCITRSRECLRDSYDVARLIRSRDYMLDISGSIVFPYGDR